MFFGVLPVFKHFSTSHWDEANAYIIDLEQIVSQGEDSTSYGVKGRYRYLYRGIEYHSDRLNFYSGTDNIGDYQQAFYARLDRMRSENTSVPAWVNPDEPEEAVIDKNIRIGLLFFMVVFGAVFSGAGVAVLLISRYVARKSAGQSELANRFPDEPWRWRKEWEGGSIKSNAGLSYKGLTIFALFWNLISLPVAAVVILGEESHPIGIQLLILLFPAVGVFLIYLAYQAYQNWRKYGNAALKMHTKAFAIGGKSFGEIKVPGTRPSEDFILTLTCVEKTRRRRGNKTRTYSKPLWQGDQRVETRPSSDGVGKLEYAFVIPKNLPKSNNHSRKRNIEWKVAVKGVKRTDLKLEFEVPGFVVNSENNGMNDTPTWNEDNVQTNNYDYTSTTGDWTQLGVIQRKERGGTHYYFPPARNLKITLGFPLFGVIFLGTGIGLYLAGAGLLFSIVFGTFGLFFSSIGIQGLLFRSEIRIANETLSVRSGLITMRDKAEMVASEIRRLDISTKMRSGNALVYRLTAELQNGDRVLLAKNLLIKSDLQALINQILSDLGLPAKRETKD